MAKTECSRVGTRCPQTGNRLKVVVRPRSSPQGQETRPTRSAEAPTLSRGPDLPLTACPTGETVTRLAEVAPPGTAPSYPPAWKQTGPHFSAALRSYWPLSALRPAGKDRDAPTGIDGGSY
eukprot:5237529-Pyramimonas_sp.AAC.1